MKIVESGTLQALRSVTYSSSIPGSQAKILEIAPEGTQASVGDVLIRFDSQPFADELELSRPSSPRPRRSSSRRERS